jgi:hypothetical protein
MSHIETLDSSSEEDDIETTEFDKEKIVLNLGEDDEDDEDEEDEEDEEDDEDDEDYEDSGLEGLFYNQDSELVNILSSLLVDEESGDTAGKSLSKIAQELNKFNHNFKKYLHLISKSNST